MPGSGFGGLAEGLWESVSNTRAENRQREVEASEREAKILQHLSTADDPETRNLALAGLLEMGNPKRRGKGLGGFFGEMEKSETLPKIRELLNTPVQKQVTTPGLPSRGVPASVGMQAIPQPPPSMGGAAMSSGSMVAGAPPPQPEGPPRPAFTEQRATPEVGRVDTVSTPRQAFLDPDERLRKNTIAREEAEIDGMTAAMRRANIPEDQIQQAIRAHVGGRYGAGVGAGGSVKEGNVHQNDQGEWVQDLYDASGNVVKQIPAMNPRQTRAGAVNYSTAVQDVTRRLFAPLTYGELDQDQAERVYQTLRKEKPEAAADLAHARGRATGDESIATKFNTPISPDDAAQQGVAMGTTMAQVAGQTPQTPAMQDVRRNSAVLKELLPSVKATIRAALPSSNETFGNLTPGLIMKARRLDPNYRNQIAAMESAVNLLVNNIARVVGGAKGAQSEKDAVRAEAAITNLKEGWISGDTAESAEARIDEAMSAIDAVLASLPPEMAPTQTPGVAPKPGQAAQPGSNPTPAPAAAAAGQYTKGQIVRLKDGTYREITSVSPLKWRPSTGPKAQ